MTLDLLSDLVALADGRCDHIDARHVDAVDEHVGVRDGRVDRVEREESCGIGVRVRAGGAWGFAATRETSRAAGERALARALAVAEAGASAIRSAGGRPGPLAPVEPSCGHWRSPHDQDPLAVPLEERVELLLAAERAMAGDSRLARTEASAVARRVRTALATSAGTACTQDRVTCGAGLAAVAVGEGEVQVRTFPQAHGGDVAQAGWEHVVALDLAGHAPRVAAEAVELLTAPPCPTGATALVLGAEQVALQVHESIGHALELDRILLGEASYAGTSFVAAADLGELVYGSEHLNVVADATSPGGLGTFGWDDEGVPAARTPLIEAGRLRGALSDREAAAAIGLERSGGCARAEGFDRQPIVRMTNVNLEAGSAGALEDLLADTGEGLYLETNRSWSIDDRRLHFQFATEVAREIRGGELGRLYRNPSYHGVTPRFWASLDAVCSASAWRLHGLTNCGKGEPGQLMAVSHGAAPCRFRGVEVGVA